MANLPWYGTAFNVTVHLFTTAGLITNPGTLTCKISKDYGDYANCHGTGPTEEDSTYGQIKVALDATDMTATHIDGIVVDNTSGCIHALFHIDTIPVTRGLAGTALPDAAADAAGGLPISDAGALDLDTYIKRLEAAWTAALAARIDENISAAKTLTATYDAAKTAASQTSVDTIDNLLDTEFPLLMKWFLNKMVRTDNGDGTIDYVLYDDDNTTPLKTWVHTTATGTRAKAT